MKRIILLLIFCFLFSCERKEPNFSKEMIEKLAINNSTGDDVMLPTKYSYLVFYFRTNENEVFMTTQNHLYVSYKLYYSKKYKSFKIFLETFLDKDFVFDENSPLIIENKFKLNPKIEKEYSVIGFDEFLKKYSEPSRKHDFELELNRSNIKAEEYFTIKYLLFINNYDVVREDVRAKDYIRKREDSFK